METRICRICQAEKEISAFEIDSRKKDKRTNRCYDCKYALDDKAQRAFRGLKRRSATLGIPMEVTAKEIRLLLEMFQGRCAYCGKRPEKESLLHLDHICALSEGGRNTLANLIPVCAADNLSKKSKPLTTYFLDNRDKFTDENMSTVIKYMSLLSGMSNEDMAKELTDEHISYLLKQSWTALDKEVTP